MRVLRAFGLVLLNAVVYFLCQTIASTCLAQVLAQFPVQVESLFPLRVKAGSPSAGASGRDVVSAGGAASTADATVVAGTDAGVEVV